MPNRYALNQALFSFGGDAWIEDEAGNRAFEVDGKAFAIGRTLDLLDPAGTFLYRIRQPVLRLHPTFEISRGEELVATIQKALLTFFGDRFTISLADGGELQAEGDFLDHEFRVLSDGVQVIAASRSWFSMHDTYGIEVADGFDNPLALAIAISIEQLESEERRGAAGLP
jgi:uncharacterized protein YxjI